MKHKLVSYESIIYIPFRLSILSAKAANANEFLLKYYKGKGLKKSLWIRSSRGILIRFYASVTNTNFTSPSISSEIPEKFL